MVKYNKYIYIACAAIGLMSCAKVDPTGVLIGHTSVDDRVKQSLVYWEQDLTKKKEFVDARGDEYSFLVVADSHTTTDLRRLTAVFDESIKGDKNYRFVAHLGDLAETQPEYYDGVETLVKKYEADTIKGAISKFAFYPVVGNHDVTRNGWAMFTQIFGSSTYLIYSFLDDELNNYDLLLFLDSANGTFGEKQFNEFLESDNVKIALKGARHVFAFTHTNFFRPRTLAFSATLPREELYFMLNYFAKNEVDAVFCGHIHKWDERSYGKVKYITLDALSADNSPEKGMIVKVTCKKDGTIEYSYKHVVGNTDQVVDGR